jgi:1-aminocyclopropane-1-carboxylate deaminase/D-cysteine desulfhydrase-like pyridoxal-dependent ACC family enzyme
LDYLIGDALAKNADTLVVSGASSFSRNAAAAGRVFGMDVVLLIPGTDADQNALSQGFLDQFGAQIHLVATAAELPEAQAHLSGQLAALGRRVYDLHPGGSDTIGTLGYVAAFGQIVDFTEKTGVRFDRVIHASGSAATQAGLAIGDAISDYAAEVLGIAVSQPESSQRRRVQDLATATANMLGIAFDAQRVTVDDRFLGEGYPIPSPAGRAASELFATREGLLLDQVYGAKAAAAVVAYAHVEASVSKRTLFIHTGGSAGVYY